MKKKIVKFMILSVSVSLTCMIFGIAGIEIIKVGEQTIKSGGIDKSLVHRDKFYKIRPDMVIVKLKNRGELKGVIIQENEDGIVLDVGGGTVGLSKIDIEKIEKLMGSERKEVLKMWKKETEKTTEYRINSLDGRMMIVEVFLNDKIKTNLLVDTGASYIDISPEIGEQLGYKVTKDSKRISLRIADGSMHQGVPIVLKSVKVGEARAENVEAVIAEQGEMRYGLLGMSFLNRFHVTVDSKNNVLILKKK